MKISRQDIIESIFLFLLQIQSLSRYLYVHIYIYPYIRKRETSKSKRYFVCFQSGTQPTLNVMHNSKKKVFEDRWTDQSMTNPEFVGLPLQLERGEYRFLDLTKNYLSIFLSRAY